MAANDGCAQGRRRICLQELPEDVLAQHIFARLSVTELLNIRPTCKRWNQVILCDPRIPKGSDVSVCFLLLLPDLTKRTGTRLAISHRPVQDDWRTAAVSWKVLPEVVLSNQLLFGLEDVEGGLMLYKSLQFCSNNPSWDSPEWLISNPVSEHLWRVPKLKVAHGLGMMCREVCRPKLIETMDDSGRRGHKVVMLHLVMPKGGGSREEGTVYTHVYHRASWNLVNTTRMDKKSWPRPRSWSVEASFAHGKFAMFVLECQYRSTTKQRKLWAFDSVEESCKCIDVAGPLLNLPVLRFVSCFGNVFAIDCGRGKLTLYKHTSYGGLPCEAEGCWSRVTTIEVDHVLFSLVFCTGVNHCIYMTTFGVQVIYNVLDGTFRRPPAFPAYPESVLDSHSRPLGSLRSVAGWCFRPSHVAGLQS